ncbi:MAG TPA: cell division ATP-binding protein FtsE [Chromatiales bacterium]|nr:cell division ATP-binding protein FtsE [Thiotrichales bacterium]HIP67175.1 cell division ATP-binding protein FtsE [Chromatiales bacterium]
MIEFTHVGKRYPGGTEALLGINLEIDQGEMVFLTGHSGAGKSTLLRLISLIERPTRGSITVNGREVSKLPHRSIPYYRRKLGVIFQDHRLLPERSVFDNVALPLQICGTDPRTIGKRVRAALDKVGLLHKEKALPDMLSSGQQQRVGIARAVVNRPAILLADEPTGNLDPELSEEIMQLFVDFNQVGVTLLIASHDQYLIRHFSKKIIELENGQIKNEDNV